MRTAIFTGRDHRNLGVADVVAEGPCAIAISRGGAAKNYAYTEPNEDACGFAWATNGALLAVADGHHGAIGAELAVRHLIEECAERWTHTPALDAATLEGEAREAIGAINAAIFAEADRCHLPTSPTTICFALVRPAEELLLHASVGDSHIFWTQNGFPVDIGWAAQNSSHPTYMGRTRDFTPSDKCTISLESLAGTRAVILVTDGFSEDGIGHREPLDALATVQTRGFDQDAEIRSLETCRGVTESAMAIQKKNRAGDNISCAVWMAG